VVPQPKWFQFSNCRHVHCSHAMGKFGSIKKTILIRSHPQQVRILESLEIESSTFFKERKQLHTKENPLLGGFSCSHGFYIFLFHYYFAYNSFAVLLIMRKHLVNRRVIVVAVAEVVNDISLLVNVLSDVIPVCTRFGARLCTRHVVAIFIYIAIPNRSG
jgi:hypothetical protein